MLLGLGRFALDVTVGSEVMLLEILAVFEKSMVAGNPVRLIGVCLKLSEQTLEDSVEHSKLGWRIGDFDLTSG